MEGAVNVFEADNLAICKLLDIKTMAEKKFEALNSKHETNSNTKIQMIET